MKPADVLFVGPHPDDVEIAAAGTILRCAGHGITVSVIDVTRGEMGSRGTPEQRLAEAAAAAKVLGLHERHNLGLPDTAVAVDAAAERALVQAIRAIRPRLLFAPHRADVHPDHVAVAALAERAFFLAGLVRHAPELGAPHRPRLLIRYPGNHPVEPTFVVDIADLRERKAEALGCYRSQLQPPDRNHLVLGLDVRERAELRDRWYGARIASAAAEPFWLDGPLPLRDLAPLI